MVDIDVSIEKQLEAAKTNAHHKNDMIKAFMPFVLKTCVSYVKRPLSYGIDEELSIGLMAFSEAIERYDEGRGLFLSYAVLIIRSRLTDYFRSKRHLAHEVLYDFSLPEVSDDLSQLKRFSNYFENNAIQLRQFEISDLKILLIPFGIQFKDLIGNAPKSSGLRKELFNCIMTIWEMELLYDKLLHDKKLPIKWISSIYPIHMKKLERNRKYIILLLLIHSGDFPYLRQYIDLMIKEVMS